MRSQIRVKMKSGRTLKGLRDRATDREVRDHILLLKNVSMQKPDDGVEIHFRTRKGVYIIPMRSVDYFFLKINNKQIEI